MPRRIMTDSERLKYTVQKPDRLVLIRTEDERWQTTRYSSGLHSAELMKDDFMNEDIERILWDRINVSMGS